jgi:enoyl-CoA hydratase/carnithine racemase
MRYDAIEITRSESGVTEIRFHSDGGPLAWSAAAHREAQYAFSEVGGDPETKVVIVTGTGDEFCARFDGQSFAHSFDHGWEPIWWEGRRMLTSLLAIDVPVIGVVNGPATVHGEIPLLTDVVIAADTAVFADDHFPGAVPGDGVHLVWPWLLGPRRGKYFLLTNERIDAREALRLGVVSEVLPPAEVLPRARALAEEWAKLPLPLLRYTRDVLNIRERETLLAGLSVGLGLEGLAMADHQTLALRKLESS